jgi:hypothetical protein
MNINKRHSKLKVRCSKTPNASYTHRYPTFQKRKKGIKTVENKEKKEYWLPHKAKEFYAHICFFACSLFLDKAT